ncbi:MAG TPA: hypothetical protein VGM31_07155 [Puia sp.]|jgi:hypothetical protein
MELDSLKYAWRTLDARHAPDKSPAEIRALLQRRSGGIVARMRRNLLGELILIAATYTPAILFYFLDFEGKLSGIAWLFILLLATFSVYFYKKYQLLKAMQCTGCSLHGSLRQQVATLKKYIRFYIWSGTMIVPVMVLLTWFIIRQQFPATPGADLYYQLSGTPWWQQPFVWTILLLPLTVGIYFVNWWYVHRLYGRHIGKLQDLLREMEEE